MEDIGNRLIWYYVPFTDIRMPLGGLNILTLFNSVVVMAGLLFLFWLGSRKLRLVPGRGQAVAEMFVGAFDGLVSSSLELDTREANRRFLPLIAALFPYLFVSNCMGFIPINYFEEPTADINTTLSLGIMGMTIATACSMWYKGIGGYFKELLGPLWDAEEGAGTGAVIAGKLSAVFFFPLNIIGECSKIVSISFRIFGNIMGGGIIMVVVSHLVYYLILPVPLNFYFVFFAGLIQAFVFTMLTLTYIAVAIK